MQKVTVYDEWYSFPYSPFLYVPSSCKKMQIIANLIAAASATPQALFL
jgi:hypothetical protein